jgi:V/A-type H+/Na+-transporting ATPase subunit D
VATVSKGALRQFKLKSARLKRAVPTLDLRRKQLNREILVWEEELLELEKRFETLEKGVAENPHAEIEGIVVIDEVKTTQANIAGVILDEVEAVTFKPAPYSFFSTPPSFDYFVRLRREFLEVKELLEAKRNALAVLIEELLVTTQRINLFEKRLIPMYEEEIGYIKGRLEDNERTTVMVAKIAQREMSEGAA